MVSTSWERDGLLLIVIGRKEEEKREKRREKIYKIGSRADFGLLLFASWALDNGKTGRAPSREEEPSALFRDDGT